jgi:hypothetical protein
MFSPGNQRSCRSPVFRKDGAHERVAVRWLGSFLHFRNRRRPFESLPRRFFLMKKPLECVVSANSNSENVAAGSSDKKPSANSHSDT